MKITIKSWKYLIIVLIFSFYAEAQMKGLSISSGISNTWILGDNPAAKPIFERDTTIKPFVYGGGFDGVQPGSMLKFAFAIDKQEKWVVPVTLDFVFFDSRQRIPITSNTTAFLKHYAYIPSASIGINYAFLKFPFAEVKAFGGLDAKYYYINQGKMYTQIKYYVDNISDVREIGTKESAHRLGGLAYLGFEGVIVKPIYIESTFGVGAMNLIGKDDNRKELLTPRSDFESGESTVFYSYFTLNLKYKF